MEIKRMYICLECDHVFEEGEEARWEERHGLDTPPYEQWRGCPICKGGFEEAVECKICGEWHSEDDLNGGVCEKCIDEYRHDFDICYDISFDDSKTEVEINPLIASLLDEGDINQILREFIQKNMPDVDCSAYIDEDISWFGEHLVKRKGGVK